MISQKPVIGLVGGIGSGKTLAAKILAELGAVSIIADELVREAYAAVEVRAAIRSLWGDQVFLPDGSVDRPGLAERVFASRSDLRRLEMVIHPWVARRRAQLTAALAQRPGVKAFVVDAPLLFEAHLDGECDFIVFVDCRPEIRAKRLLAERGWGAAEIARREAWQLPVDFKRDRADYIVENNSDADTLVREIKKVFTRIQSRTHTQDR
jgi:dephospho-CoA kinase